MVDLDGTLIRTDILHESTLRALCDNPFDALRIPYWISKGKAALKRHLARRVDFDPKSLPYKFDLLDWLKEQRAQGRIIILCTASDRAIATAISEHLGVFDEVMALEMDIPDLVEYTNLRPLDQSIVYVPFYMPGEHPKFAEPDQTFLNKVRHYLKKINSALTDEDFIDLRASRYRFAQPICDPGFLDKLPPVALPVKGLWVADTSYYYPEDRGISESIAFGKMMAKQAVV